jgi:hypothetical protein
VALGNPTLSLLLIAAQSAPISSCFCCANGVLGKPEFYKMLMKTMAYAWFI